MKNTLFSLLIIFTFIQVSFTQTNQYIHFDGQNDYISVAEASQYIANDNSISMTGWFNPDNLVYGAGMMGIRGLGTGSGVFYVLQLSNGKLECRLGTANGTFDVPNPDGTLIANQWQHVAFVYNGSTVEGFIDGVSVGSAAASGTITSIDKPFGIGKSLAGNFNFVYPGKADEVTLWSKALTQGEISAMMTNELVGNEAGLELYFKCNQGFPDGNNTSINTLINEVGSGTRNGEITNLRMDSIGSNFGGTLVAGMQAISFPQITTRTTLDNPFDLDAISTSGLEVSYEVVSGPATVSGNTVSLNGTAGFVTIKAKQVGNTIYTSAPAIESTFEVIDPSIELSNIDIRNPLNGPVYSPTLSAIELAAIVDTDFEDILSVGKVEFIVNGENVSIKDWGNNHYTGWWTPPAYGTYSFEVKATNNYGFADSKIVDFVVTQTAQDINIDAFTDAWVYADVSSVVKTGELPSYVGAFDTLIGVLDIVCPIGGCDPWDRISRVEAKGHNGEWFEIIRYLTPYGVACSHEIDLTDFMSIFQGKIDFRVSLGTQGNGFEYNLNLDYKEGIPAQKYSTIDKLWGETYQFGDHANRQPCEIYNFQYQENTEASVMKLVSTGHGWSGTTDVNANTGNGAEFHEDTHHIWVEGSETFTQHNWLDCNPNPDGCSPQGGTWYHDRAGWCPGSIAPWFDFEMTSHISENPIELKYIFDEDYLDLCHPNHPNCITGVTCDNCDGGFNPHLVVTSFLISKSNNPYDTDTTYRSVLGVNDLLENENNFYVYPNPSVGPVTIDLSEINEKNVEVNVFDFQGAIIKTYHTDKKRKLLNIDMSNFSKGVYLIQVSTESKTYSKKLILE